MMLSRFMLGVVALLVSMSANSGQLCSASCEFTIDFTDGGHIIAVEPLTITFGDDGVVDNGATVVMYSMGDMITLLSGESLDFGVGGSFDIGDGGNIDYTSVAIQASSASLEAVGDEETITFFDFYSEIEDFKVLSNAMVSIGSTFTLIGTLDLGAGTLFNDGAIAPGVTGNANIATVNGNLVNTGTITWDGGGNNLWVSSNNWSGGVTSSPYDDAGITLGSGWDGDIVVTPLSGNLSIDIELVPVVWQVDEGVLSLAEAFEFSGFAESSSPIIMLEDYTQEEFAELYHGALFATPDGGTCTMEEEGCLTDAGAKYVLVDGELVLEENGSSMSIWLLSLFGLLPLLRQRRSFCMR